MGGADRPFCVVPALVAGTVLGDRPAHRDEETDMAKPSNILADEEIDSSTDYFPGWGIWDYDGATVATITRVDVDDARVQVETTGGERFYVYVGESFARVEERRREVAARLPLGVQVVDIPSPGCEPEPRVGVIVEPTDEDTARGEAECCCFNSGSAYVLVEWSYPEYPEDGVEREWESPDDLRVADLAERRGGR